MNPEELARENEALRDRLSRLSEASLNINASLDFDRVLQGVLDSARSLTGAQYGGISTIDDAGRPKDFVTSGMTPEEHQAVVETPDGPQFLEYLLSLSSPLRTSDVAGHFSSVGLPEFKPPMPASSLMVTSLRDLNGAWGIVYLANRENGGEFTAEDEETLVIFAAQAALVIANARKHQDEQKARRDLETLIETSPVGVVAIDARTAAPVSINQEAMRIAGPLMESGHTLEELFEMVTVRRADGREYSLTEVPLFEIFQAGEMVRAEEVVITAPDGRSISVLMNSTPIRSEEGEIETFLVIAQDMTPLEEQERLRAEFLAMVSHELRTPLTSVKGAVASMLDPSQGLNLTETTQYLRVIDSQADRMRRLISDLLDVARIETGTLAVSPEPTDLALLVSEARNSFRSGGGRHNVQIDVAQDLPWVMADRLRMVQVLGNLLTNAARHSPESSPIQVSAERDGVNVVVSVSDDGRGIPAESLPHLFRKFSRIESEDQRGDTGLGLAICKGIVEAHGGRIRAESDGPGLGARFIFTIPTVEASGYVSPVVPAQLSARAARRRAAEQVRILAVDDDPQALRYIRETLSNAGYEPMVTGDAQEALRLVEEEKPRLVLLDLVLPGTDGIELMKDIAETTDVPVIFLSAFGQDRLVAQAFDMGAADYVVKPFSPTELAARIRGALRRRDMPEPSQPYVLGDLTIDYDERKVTLAGSPVELTALEYRTLAELSTYAGRVLTYERLLRRVWGMDPEADLRPMRTMIRSLRRKLGDNAENPSYIFTELRVGYRMPKGEEQVKENEDHGTAGQDG